MAPHVTEAHGPKIVRVIGELSELKPVQAAYQQQARGRGEERKRRVG